MAVVGDRVMVSAKFQQQRTMAFWLQLELEHIVSFKTPSKFQVCLSVGA